MGRPIKDYTGRRFGTLTVIRLVDQIDQRAVWLCRCDCGNEVHRRGGHILSAIKRGTRSSCGCNSRGTRPTHSDTGSREYRTWLGMRARCYKKTHHKYPLYGGRGIRVCHQWRNSYAQFLKDVGRCPGEGYTLDRYPNNDGNYEPGNVRWATYHQQNKNRRTKK